MTHAEKLTRFLATSAKHQAVMVCAKCGSARIDQNTWAELKCYDCRNTMRLDTTCFGVARNACKHDAANAFRLADKIANVQAETN